MKRVSFFLITTVALFLTGCASVSSTAVFYSPTATVFYTPKDPHTVIPILNAPPRFPYTEIGKFAFQSGLGYPFIQRAIEYNAQRAGADAVIIKDYKTWSVPSYYTVPPVYGWIPVGGWYGGGCGGWYAGGAVPFSYPGYTGVSYQTFAGVDARMIVFKR